jgi:general secretion pathway protein J
MCHETGAPHQRGFSLLEILVALTVLGLLIVGLNEGVRTGFAMWGRQTRQIGGITELDSTARLLRNLLGGIPLIPTAAANPGNLLFNVKFSGTADQLTFLGDLPTGLGTSRRADITLALRNERLVLLWTPHRREPPGAAAPPANETELLRGVTRVEFAYWGTAAVDSPATWVTEWNVPTMPQLIRIRLGFREGDSRHWPDMIVAPQLWMPQS